MEQPKPENETKAATEITKPAEPLVKVTRLESFCVEMKDGAFLSVDVPLQVMRLPPGAEVVSMERMGLAAYRLVVKMLYDPHV